MATRLRLLNANFRLEPYPGDDEAGRGWDDRRDATIALIKSLNPQVITGQECSANIRADLLEGLGGSTEWGYYRNGNVIVWIKKDEVERISYDNTIHLPSAPDADPRRLVVVQIRLKATGDVLWVASSHFTVGDPYWQNRQMQAVVDELTANHNIRNTIFGADVNNIDDVRRMPPHHRPRRRTQRPPRQPRPRPDEQRNRQHVCRLA